MVWELIRRPSRWRLISVACFMGDGQVVFFSLVITQCALNLVICTATGTICSGLAYNSWLDLGLFFSCNAGSAMNPSPSLAPAADVAASPSHAAVRGSHHLCLSDQLVSLHTELSQRAPSLPRVFGVFNALFLIFCFVLVGFLSCHFKKKKKGKRRY